MNAYFADVGRAEIGLVSQEAQFNSDLQSFSLTRSTPSELGRLSKVKREIDLASRRVRALRPPEDAHRLQSLIVQRLALQRSVIDELIATALYIPRLRATVPPLQAAAVGLRGDLAAIQTSTPAPTPTPLTSSGGQLFATAGCGGCHTLADAGSTGTAGPNLDALKPDAATVAARVRAGRGGMPSFRGTLSDSQITVVAAYVASASGTPSVASNGAVVALGRYAAAFGSYGDALKPVSAVIEGLKASPIMQPALDAERRALERSIVLCATIRRTLLRRDVTAANAAIHSLFGVSAALNGVQTGRQQAAAARAYNERIHQVDVLTMKANVEHDRLVQAIG